MYKLLATDLDGTLFNSRTEVSAENRRAITEAVERGVHFVLCSGRAHYEGVSKLGEDLGLNCPGNYYICCSGGVIVDAATLEIKVGNYLDKETAGLILKNAEELFQEIGTSSVRIHTTEQFYGKYIEDDAYEKLARNNISLQPVPENLGDLKGEIMKLLFWKADDAYTRKFFARMHEKLPAHVQDYPMFPYIAEYVAKKAQKGIAILQLAEFLGIAPEETAAVGDGWNDISMLEDAGLGIAVKNAPAEVAEHADVVLDVTNDEDAIARVIERYF